MPPPPTTPTHSVFLSRQLSVSLLQTNLFHSLFLQLDLKWCWLINKHIWKHMFQISDFVSWHIFRLCHEPPEVVSVSRLQKFWRWTSQLIFTSAEQVWFSAERTERVPHKHQRKFLLNICTQDTLEPSTFCTNFCFIYLLLSFKSQNKL